MGNPSLARRASEFADYASQSRYPFVHDGQIESPVPLGERGHGSPTHCIRRCIRTELIRSGVQEAVVLYLVGQSQGLTGAAYVPEGSPEESPYWPRLVKAVALIPAVGEVVSGTTGA